MKNFRLNKRNYSITIVAEDQVIFVEKGKYNFDFKERS